MHLTRAGGASNMEICAGLCDQPPWRSTRSWGDHIIKERTGQDIRHATNSSHHQRWQTVERETPADEKPNARLSSCRNMPATSFGSTYRRTRKLLVLLMAQAPTICVWQVHDRGGALHPVCFVPTLEVLPLQKKQRPPLQSNLCRW